MISASSHLPPAAPTAEEPQTLRLFDPKLAPPPVYNPVLSEAYETHVLPALIEDEQAKRTIEEDRSAIKKWGTRTPNPGILSPREDLNKAAQQLRESLLVDVRAGKLTRQTVRKCLRHLRKVFRRLAPETSRNPNGCGLIRRVPVFKNVKLPKRRKATRRLVPLSDVESLFVAGCEKALRLRGLSKRGDVRSSDVWRAALVVDHFYGPRTRDLIGAAAPRDDVALGLRRGSIILSAAHPDGDVPFEWPAGWIRYVAEKTGAEIILPLAPIVRAHLLPLLAGLEADERIFPVPSTKRSFYRHWNAIKEAAGVTTHLQEIRKQASTSWNKLWPRLGEFVLGHRPETVNEEYYNDYTGKLIELLPKFPFPAAFDEVRPRQRSLFD